jgi:nitroreductase
MTMVATATPDAGAVDVYGGVRTRHSLRRFTDRPVPRDTLEPVPATAAEAPSGANLQPWHIYVLSGARLATLKKRVAERIAASDCGDDREFAIYPPEICPPYQERMAVLGERLYGALGIARDEPAPARARAQN